jgi:hypothetical protein
VVFARSSVNISRPAFEKHAFQKRACVNGKRVYNEAMEAPATSSRPASRRRPGKRHIILLVAAALLFVFLGRWWVSKPQPYRFIGRYPLYNCTDSIWPTSTGFLLRESDNLYIMRDWATGQERWRVTASGPVAISPEGRYFVTLDMSGSQNFVRFWENGKPLAPTALVLPAHAHQYGSSAFAIDDRALCFLGVSAPSISPQTCLFAVAPGRIIARDTLPVQAILSPDGKIIGSHSSGGESWNSGQKAFQHSYTLDYIAQVSAEGAKFHYTHRRVLRGQACLGLDGKAIDFINYRSGQAIYPPTGRSMVFPYGYSLCSMSPDWHYASLTDESRPNRVMVKDIDAGKSWETTIRHALPHSIQPTNDGQAIIASVNTDFYATAPGIYIRKHAPAVAKHLPDRNRMRIVYCRKPGKVLARLTAPKSNGISFNVWEQSPDGRSLLLRPASDRRLPGTPELPPAGCLLYRW